MFTGIIEEVGQVLAHYPEGSNQHFWLSASFVDELSIDQSVAHNGVCLTVVEILNDRYRVTAVEETLLRSNLKDWQEGTAVNLERCMPASGRFDGHIVQGHVDTTAQCVEVNQRDGSWYFHFRHPQNAHYLTVEKGSITVNGVSLTVVDSQADYFSVAIIPYTYAHTNFAQIKAGSAVNLEFDVVGKYVARLLQDRDLLR